MILFLVPNISVLAVEKDFDNETIQVEFEDIVKKNSAALKIKELSKVTRLSFDEFRLEYIGFDEIKANLIYRLLTTPKE